jgi:hypothetical protein
MGCTSSKKAEVATVAVPNDKAATAATEAVPREGVTEPHKQGKTQEADTTDAVSEITDPAPKERLPTIRPGVKVTTIDGKEGIVVQRTATDVTLRAGDSDEFVVDIESIYIVKVTVCSARGLRGADLLTGKSDPYVTVEIQCKPESRAQTTVKAQTLSCTWDEELEILGFTPGDKLSFAVWDHDRLKSDDFLGKFVLESDQFEKTEYDAEVELPELDAKKKGAFVKVKVSLVPQPKPPASAEIVIDSMPAPLFRWCA